MTKRYKENNIKYTDSYKCYDSRVPKFLHNRPRGVVEHIMKRIDTEIQNVRITQQTLKHFTVRSLHQMYQVWLGSEHQLPSCQCIDYRTKRLPCKHICAVVRQPGVGWESLGSRFANHPLLTLDQEVTQAAPILVDNSELPCDVEKCTSSCDPTSTSMASSSTPLNRSLSKEENPPGNNESFAVPVNLPSRKRPNIRKQCIQAVKTLHDELYIATDDEVLTKTLKMITDIIEYTRKHHPSENGITLKDKSLSPKKIKKKISFRNSAISQLAKRKRKNYYTKRVGTVADSKNAKVAVNETGEVTTSQKRSKAQASRIDNRKKRRDTVTENKEKNPNDIWVMIGAIKLTYHLREILLNPFAWLTDDHIDAAQHLIKELGTGVGGLNCIATMTHCTRFAVPHEQNQTIQCHNIGAHWVTSSSITGKVIVYESMNTTLNDSLKRQLVCLYKHLCNDDGSLEISVILQQRQKGNSDCGLFCIANSVALANGIDPCTIFWHQNSMREHLCQCFEQKKITMFPHDVKQAPSIPAKSHYVVSIYCVCLKHVPGAQMVHCSVCNNWFHYGHPQNCIGLLSAEQAAALATNAPFVCEYCALHQKKGNKLNSFAAVL